MPRLKRFAKTGICWFFPCILCVYAKFGYMAFIQNYLWIYKTRFTFPVIRFSRRIQGDLRGMK